MKQLGFDWDRAERDGLIDEADLLPESMEARGSTIKRHWMVNMLRTLNGFINAQNPECWASQKLLAIKMGLRSPGEPDESERGIKTVQRTLDALAELSLVIVNRRVPKGGVKPVNHYRLVWSELMLLNSRRRSLLFPKLHPEGREKQQDFSDEQQDFSDEQQDFSDEQQDFSDEQQDFFGDQQDLKSPNLLTYSKSIKPSPLKSPKIARSLGSAIQGEEKSSEAARFDRLVEEYERVPVYGAVELLSKAASRVGVEYLERLLKHYRDHSGWGPGALRCRVGHSRPGMDISAGWASPTKAAAQPEPNASEQRGDAWSAAQRRKAINRTDVFRGLQAKLGRAPTDEELASALNS